MSNSQTRFPGCNEDDAWHPASCRNHDRSGYWPWLRLASQVLLRNVGQACRPRGGYAEEVNVELAQTLKGRRP